MFVISGLVGANRAALASSRKLVRKWRVPAEHGVYQ